MATNWILDGITLALVSYGVACCVVPAGRPAGESARDMLRAYARRCGPRQQRALCRQAEAALVREGAGFPRACAGQADADFMMETVAVVPYHDAAEASLQPGQPDLERRLPRPTTPAIGSAS